jgi:hypothetical protein
MASCPPKQARVIAPRYLLLLHTGWLGFAVGTYHQSCVKWHYQTNGIPMVLTSNFVITHPWISFLLIEIEIGRPISKMIEVNVIVGIWTIDL